MNNNIKISMVDHAHLIVTIGDPNTGKSSLIQYLSKQPTDVRPEPVFDRHESLKFYPVQINEVIDAVSKTYLVDVGGIKFRRARSDLEMAEILLEYMKNLPEKLKVAFKREYPKVRINKFSFAI